MQSLVDGQNNFIIGQRLLNKVKGSDPGGLDCCFNGTMAGYHDDRQVAAILLDFFQGLKPVHARHPDVEQDQMNFLLFQDFKAFFSSGSCKWVKTLIG